jgi:hypothetical protein
MRWTRRISRNDAGSPRRLSAARGPTCATYDDRVAIPGSARLAGYSNLKLIADLDPKVVKLDRALVQDLHRKPRQQKLVSMVVRLCNELRSVNRKGCRGEELVSQEFSG